MERFKQERIDCPLDRERFTCRRGFSSSYGGIAMHAVCTKTIWSGLEAYTLSNALYEAVILPDYGANCIALRDRRTGTQLLRLPGLSQCNIGGFLYIAISFNLHQLSWWFSFLYTNRPVHSPGLLFPAAIFRIPFRFYNRILHAFPSF